MADPSNMEELVQLAETKLGGANVIDRVEISFCYNKKTKKGVGVSPVGLLLVEITESMFNLLPTIRLAVNNTGFADDAYVPKAGDNIHVIIAPNLQDEGEKRLPLVEADFAIMEVYKSLTIDNDIHVTRYEILGVLEAQAYLNNRCCYPTDDPILHGKITAKEAAYLTRGIVDMTVKSTGEIMPVAKSSDVLRNVFDGISLTLITEVEPDDSGFWLCANQTYAEFAKKVVDHAWISVDDAPLLFTDLDGNTHYTSIKKVSKNMAFVQRNADKESGKKYAKTQTLYRCVNSGIKPNDESITYGFNDISTLNGSGSIVTHDGYSVRQGFFSTMGSDAITDTENIRNPSILATGAVEKLLSFLKIQLPSFMHRQTDNNYGDVNLADVDLRPPTQNSHYTGFYNAGMLVPELHEHYLMAPKHNELMRRAFFQTFVKMTIDTKMQPEEYHLKEWQPKLGTVINVDASGSKYNESVVSCKYVVVKIVHRFVKGESFTQAIYGATDGAGGIGQIVQPKNEDK